MPQESLWAVQARTNGVAVLFQDADRMRGKNGLFSVTPLWTAKNAEDRASLTLPIPEEMNVHLPQLAQVAMECWLYGATASIPGVVRARLRDVQLGYPATAG